MTTLQRDRLEHLKDLRLEAEGRKPPVWVPLPHQHPPEDGFYGWLLQAGRGAGKTATCARYVHDHVNGPPCLPGPQPHRVGIIGPTLGDVVEACVLGPYGLRHHDPAAQFRGQPSYHVEWPNGSQAMLFGGKNPDDIERLRAKGGNRCLLWFEEMAAIRLLQDAYDIAEPGLRAGTHPHWIASTTPKPRPFITGGPKRVGGLMQMADVVVTHATTFDNPHLPDTQKERLRERYEGTNIGRQELLGEIVEDVPGAIWQFAEIDQDRATSHPDLTKVCVAVDPPGGATECGIVIAGRARVDGTDHFYVLEDASGTYSPNAWGNRTLRAYQEHAASKVVAESNYGGDMVESVIRHNDPDVPVEMVRATRGKAVRAAPVHDLYEQHRVHHIGDLSELEYEMTHWDPDESDWSPNRLDALVWAITWLADLGRDATIWFA